MVRYSSGTTRSSPTPSNSGVRAFADLISLRSAALAPPSTNDTEHPLKLPPCFLAENYSRYSAGISYEIPIAIKVWNNLDQPQYLESGEKIEYVQADIEGITKNLEFANRKFAEINISFRPISIIKTGLVAIMKVSRTTRES